MYLHAYIYLCVRVCGYMYAVHLPRFVVVHMLYVCVGGWWPVDLCADCWLLVSSCMYVNVYMYVYLCWPFWLVYCMRSFVCIRVWMCMPL